MPCANLNGQYLFFDNTGGSGRTITFSLRILLDGAMFAPQVAALIRFARAHSGG